MSQNKRQNPPRPAVAPPPMPTRRLAFEAGPLAGTIVWSPLDDAEAQRLAADIQQLLVQRVLTRLRELQEE